MRISTNLVQIDAVVTDWRGRVITNLRPEDFQLSVNGKLQEITHFAYVTVATAETPTAPYLRRREKGMPPPSGLRPNQVGRTFALVLDDFCMSSESIYQARKVLQKFVDEKMQPNDSAAIISTYAGTGTLQQFTTDKRQLHAAIQRLHWRRCPREEQLPPQVTSPVAVPGGGMSSAASDDAGMVAANTKARIDSSTKIFRVGVFSIRLPTWPAVYEICRDVRYCRPF